MSTFSTCTSSTRPSSPTDGDVLFETDTKNVIIWDGTNWRGYDSTLANSLAADFTGTDDYLDCGSDNELNLTSGFTYSLWVYPSNTNTWHGFFTRRSTSDNSGVMMFTSNAPDIKFLAGVVYTFTDIDIVANQWQHYAFTFDGTTLKGYRNGTLSTDTFTPTIPSVTSNVDFIIGKHHTLTGGTNQYTGLMDEFAVWSSALSASEVAVLAEGPHPLLADNGGYNSSSDLVAWWRMGDSSGDTDSGSGTPANGDTIGTVKNLANPGTHDGSAVNSPSYTNNVPN